MIAVRSTAGPTSRDPIGKRFFVLWVIAGVVWACLSVLAARMCPNIPPIERTFRTVERYPKGNPEIAQHAKKLKQYDNWVEILEFLSWGAVVYALFGIIFIGRGCIIFVIGGCVMFVCYLALLNAIFVPF